MLAPDFELPYINTQEKYRLSQDLGKIIVITFWTSWCPDCARDLPKKEQLFQSINTDVVQMITINVSGRERNKESGVIYSSKYLMQNTLADRGTEAYDLYNCQGVPTTIIIDRNGKIHDQFGENADFLAIVKSLGSLLRKPKED